MSKNKNGVDENQADFRAAGKLIVYPISSDPKDPKSIRRLNKFLVTVFPRFVKRYPAVIFGIDEISDKMRKASVRILSECNYLLCSLIDPKEPEAYRPRNLIMVMDDWQNPAPIDERIEINQTDRFDRVVLSYDKKRESYYLSLGKHQRPALPFKQKDLKKLRKSVRKLEEAIDELTHIHGSRREHRRAENDLEDSQVTHALIQTPNRDRAQNRRAFRPRGGRDSFRMARRLASVGARHAGPR